METEDWIKIGTIVGVQGLKGALRVKPDSDFPERFSQPGLRWLQLKNQSQPQSIELISGYPLPGKNLYVITLKGINNRTQAETLREGNLFVPKSDRPSLEEDEYHVMDLINLSVFNQLSGKNIGVVVDVFTAGNDLLEVKLHSLNQEIDKEAKSPDVITKDHRLQRPKKTHQKRKKATTVLIPFVKEIVTRVDLEKKLIAINPPPGLLEI